MSLSVPIGRAFMAAGLLLLSVPLAGWVYGEWQQRQEPAPAVASAPTRTPAPAVRPQNNAGTQPQVAPSTTAESSAAESPAPDSPIPGQAMGRLEIPVIDLNLTFFAGIDNEDLLKGPGHYPGTALPGTAGNFALAAHRTLRGLPSFFYHLNRVKPGDEIRVVTAQYTARYVVERVFVVPPTELGVIGPTESPALTLTTCDPPGTEDQRLIVRAMLIGVAP